MKRFKLSCLLAAFLPLLSAAAPATQPTGDYAAEFDRSYHYAGPRTQAHLDQVKRELAVPGKRLAALRELLDFAGFFAYYNPNFDVCYGDGSEAIRDQACHLLDDAADDATVHSALAGSDPLVKFWGLCHFNLLKDGRAELATLEGLAQGKDEMLRGKADDILTGFPEESAFVAHRIAVEKSAYILDSLMFEGWNSGMFAFQHRLVELMHDPDAKVQKGAIDFVEWNCRSASCRQIFIDRSMMDALVERALAKDVNSTEALSAFTTYADQPLFATAAAAGKWWGDLRHQRDWELARLPRGTPFNGPPFTATIQTTGIPDGKQGWHAVITLKNNTTHVYYVNQSKVLAADFEMLDTKGNPVRFNPALPKPAPHWVELKPGDSMHQALAPSFAGLAPGRYFLKITLELDSDNTGLPAKNVILEGQLPLPAIAVEIP